MAELTPLIPTLAFYLFSVMTVVSGLMVITSKNSVHSVFFLILAFFNAAALFVLIGSEYIAMTLVIVYVGAVAVLFLFVVMMLDVNFAELRQGFQKYLPMGLLTAGIVLFELLVVFYVSLNSPQSVAAARNPVSNEITNTHAIGAVMYTDYFLPFQMSGIVLLIAMIGAITLTLRKRPGVRRQNISEQVNRKREDAIEIVKVSSGEGIA